jgi:tetratricopeptide (TPR) repeat protein
MRAAACWAFVCLVTVGAAAASDPALRALIDAGHWKRARAALEPRVKANPSDAEAVALLSRVRHAYGDLDGALPLAEAAVRLDPKVADYHWALAQVLGDQAQHASIFRQLGLAKRFRQEAEQAIALDPKHVEARTAMISYYIQAPGIVGGDKDKAAKMVDEIAGIDPAAGYLARIQHLRETKATGDFEGLYRKAFETAKTTETKIIAIVGLMNINLSVNPQKRDAAEEQARALIALDPHRVVGHRSLALVLALSQRWADVDAAVAEGEKAVPDNLTPYYQAGRIISTQVTSDWARGERYLRKYLTQDPEPGTATWAQAHWRLGIVFEKAGKKADAIAEIEQALKLKPDLEDAKKDLKRLRAS